MAYTAQLTLKQLSSRLPAILDSGLSLEIISAPGRGKSTLVKDFVRKANEAAGYRKWGLATLFLATQTPPDLIGYIMKGERTFTKDGKDIVVPVSEATMPSWMCDDETGQPAWMFERFIVFLDEYGQGEGDVKRASAELLLNGRLGPWQLPKGASVIAASNRAEDRSGVTRSFDFVINRRVEVYIVDDLPGFKEWAHENNMHPALIQFAEDFAEIVFSSAVPENQGPWCTPRSLHMLNRLLVSLSGNPDTLATDDVAAALAEGTVGSKAAGQVFSHIRAYNALPTYEEAVASPTTCLMPEAADLKMLMLGKMAHSLKPEHMDKCLTYLKRFGREFDVIFVRTVLKRHPKLMTQPTFLAWVKENSSLINAIQAR